MRDNAQPAINPIPQPAPTLRSRQILTVALLFGGYAACYFCRADFSVSTPLLIDELGRRGISHAAAMVHIGQIASLGVFAYALGKLFLTGLGDFWGGRPSFLIGLCGATLFTVLFTLGGTLPVFTLAWLGNRLTQSIAWAGLLKVSSKWFDFSSHGTIVGILSVSYLIGDAVARQWMSVLIHRGYGWRELFYLAAVVAGVFLIANLVMLRESRTELGYAEAVAHPLNLYGDSSARPANLRGPGAAAAKEPGVFTRVPVVARLHRGARNLQYLDPGVSARLFRLQHGRRSQRERRISGGRGGVGHRHGMVER